MASATHATLKNTSHTHLLEQKRDFSIKITSRICRFETCIVYLTYPNFKLSGLVSWERVTRIPGLHSKEHYGQTNNTKLQTLLSPSLKKRTAQELFSFLFSLFFFFFFFCPHHHRLEPPQWRPSEGPHTWGLKATDRRPKHHLIYTSALPFPSHLYLKLGPATYHIKKIKSQTPNLNPGRPRNS